MPVDKKMKILVVDDFATMRRIIKNTLRQIGYENVVEAEDGEAAVAKLETERIDFIVSDWNMPKMTGLELLRWVRNHDEFKDLPFLMVTAEAQKENILEAAKARVNNYVVKPFTAETMEEKIEAIMAKL
ncbi:response regulator receiver protein [Desulfarculus baarsii DSM 2075]|uniref:Response regulator receiver protein n=1 Tax=Desulfarculus baarsii (strain ATCC 33931 / DSM 2075 / LMG 7858 / VKM B-1802 / 2st14) TaxID=644282 RepID=E1QG13_DESB2|nr:chemotaxis response regulator CheY [Desulfarculus baarsii]ADK84623.1 response regulator receiver protein [Desulfarculus baarsii DSM 2075]